MDYYYKTRVGTFRIEERQGRWHVVFKDESLGSYAYPSQALDDLVGGHTFSPRDRIDTRKLDLPPFLNEWMRGKAPDR
jgi:hypothetical protein